MTVGSEIRWLWHDVRAQPIWQQVIVLLAVLYILGLLGELIWVGAEDVSCRAGLGAFPPLGSCQ